nr:DUF3817 domain-containing protein [uncultured Arsenicibacter sp.]
MINLIKTTIGQLRILAFLEGLSFIALLAIGMPLKYGYGMPEPNRIIGMLHGLLFVGYVFLVIQAKIEYRWSARKTILALLASIIPFGTFWAEVKLFNKE